MTTPDELRGLIERLEKAEGPDRDLDLAIEKALRRCDPSAWIESRDTTVLVWHEVHDFGSTTANERMEYPLPLYTDSLDAALTLVPEGWAVNVLGQIDDGRWLGTLRHIETSREKLGAASIDGGSPVTSMWRPTPALALCIAALRARLAQAEEERV